MHEKSIAASALEGLFHKLVELYAFHIETTMGYLKLTQHFEATISEEDSIELSNKVKIGGGNPNLPSTKYEYEKTWEKLICDSKEGGLNVRLHRNGVVALAYALWEDEYRQLIADECEKENKDQIKSEVFADLNKYRQAILHASGMLDKEPVKLNIFQKGEVVSFTKDQMNELFDALIFDLNRVGKEYYGFKPDFELNKPLNDEPNIIYRPLS